MVSSYFLIHLHVIAICQDSDEFLTRNFLSSISRALLKSIEWLFNHVRMAVLPNYAIVWYTRFSCKCALTPPFTSCATRHRKPVTDLLNILPSKAYFLFLTIQTFFFTFSTMSICQVVVSGGWPLPVDRLSGISHSRSRGHQGSCYCYVNSHTQHTRVSKQLGRAAIAHNKIITF